MKNVFLLLLGLANTANGQTVRCPGPYHAIGNGCYIFTALNVSSWTMAHVLCEFSGGYLAKIDSATEQMDLEVYHNEHFGDATSNYWIGATDMLGDGTWRWAPSGATLDYDDWALNGPAPSTTINCAYWIIGLYWSALECCDFYLPVYPLCEADPL